MIEVFITVDGERELARIRITNMSPSNLELADYSVQISVERDDGIGLHQRGIFGFPRKQANVLALVKQALETLNEWELEIHEASFSADMGREERDTLPEVQSWISRLHHNRPAFWSRQPKQPGGDSNRKGIRKEDRE